MSRISISLTAELKARSKITAAFCRLCSNNHNQVDCELWLESVAEEARRLETVEFAGGVDVEPLVMEEEVEEVVEKKFVVRLPVAVAESVAGARVAEDVVMVAVVGKGEEVAVVAGEAEGAISSREEDWTVVKRRVQKCGGEWRRKRLEEERDAVRKRMNVWCPAKVVVPNAALGLRGMRVVREVRGDRRVGCDDGFFYRVMGSGSGGSLDCVALVAPVGAPRGPAVYWSVALGSEKLRGLGGGGLVPRGPRG
ncbi:hypothetical protein HOY80DRAFT_1055986 [Tuber brumale]|nr:hypothetical protein HOY80DRAFT_1055986 [Tuber brumale]